jgi:alpha-D-ribose 1-methylphosphonate 5-triphosphate synthase subunit PhnH
MATYRTHISGRFDAGVVVSVQTDMTFYQVSELNGELIVHGPGVEETYLIGEQIPEGLSSEARALFAVLLWEDQA